MSLKQNITANYISQIYVTLVSILMLPLYIKYMGAEAYGLIGFFMMLQAFFVLLDLGLTPTIGRETARYHGGGMPSLEYRQLYRALSLIFSAVAIVGGGALFLLSDVVVNRWLNVESLSLPEVTLAVKIMAICIAMRWMTGLYRGVITGSERLVWLSGFNAIVATLRFILVLPVMWFYGFTPFVFFTYQLLVALVEIIGLGLKSQKLLTSAKNPGEIVGWSFEPIKPVLRFALSIAFTSSVWVLVTQTDKLVLSGILPLEEYGYFTLAVLVASGIMVISGPISTAIMPRMARLYAEGKNDELIQIYRNSTQIVSVIAGSAAITLACCAQQLLFAWTGDPLLAAKAAPILQLYAIGNGFLAVAAFPYYLQYAKGNLRYHLIGNACMVVVLIPCIIWAARSYGGLGAAYVWLAMNAVYLLTWVGYVHHKLEPGLHRPWFIDDVLKIILPAFVVALMAISFNPDLDSRIANLFYVALVGGLTMICALACAKSSRTLFLNKLPRRFKV